MSERMAMNTPKIHAKRVIYRGLQGNDVRDIQELLVDLNDFYNFCPGKNLQPSGYFGDETHRLLKFFQYWVDLLPDGFYEKLTDEALEKSYQNYMAELSIRISASSQKKAFQKAVGR